MYHFTNTNNSIDFPKMTKQLYLIDYENAHWCGGSLNVVVWAEDEEDARCVGSDHMEETQRELFAGEYEYSDENEDAHIDESAVSITSVEAFGPEHEAWKWFQDPSQAEFYPIVGEPE